MKSYVSEDLKSLKHQQKSLALRKLHYFKVIYAI